MSRSSSNVLHLREVRQAEELGITPAERAEHDRLTKVRKKTWPERQEAAWIDLWSQEFGDKPPTYRDVLKNLTLPTGKPFWFSSSHRILDALHHDFDRYDPRRGEVKGFVFPELNTLQDETGLSRPVVLAALTTLEEMRLLTKVSHKDEGRRQRSNVYVLRPIPIKRVHLATERARRRVTMVVGDAWAKADDLHLRWWNDHGGHIMNAWGHMRTKWLLDSNDHWVDDPGIAKKWARHEE